MTQILNFRNAEACRRILNRGSEQKITLNEFNGASLAGILETYFTYIATPPDVRTEFAKTRDETTSLIWNTLNRTRTNSDRARLDVRQKPKTVEFLAVNENDLKNPKSFAAAEFHLFQERFTQGAFKNGFSKTFAFMLVGIARELVDNVIQHSGVLDAPREFAVFGFHIERDYIALSIIDSGCGIRNSLTSSEHWKSINSDEEALRAVVFQNASRKTSLGTGEGFKELFRCLIDRSVSIRIRSGDSAVRLLQEGTERHAQFASTFPLSGVHVTLVCTRGDHPEEKVISIKENSIDSLTEFSY